MTVTAAQRAANLARITAPPPAGISCECEVECACPPPFEACTHEPSHWHTRFMGAVCDTCGHTRIEADVFAYTRAGAYKAIAVLARVRGWLVTTDGQYTCPACQPTKEAP